MGRNRPLPPFESLSVIPTASGLVIVREDGTEPLQDPDPIIRAQATYGMAQWSAMKAAMLDLMRVVELNFNGYHGYRHLLEFAHSTLALARPPDALIARLRLESQITPRKDDVEAA